MNVRGPHVVEVLLDSVDRKQLGCEVRAIPFLEHRNIDRLGDEPGGRCDSVLDDPKSREDGLLYVGLTILPEGSAHQGQVGVGEDPS